MFHVESIMLDYIFIIIVTLGGLILIVGTKIVMPHAPAWSRTAVRIAGFCDIIWAAIRMMQISDVAVQNTVAGRLLQGFKMQLIGVEVGILISVFLSGAFNKKK